MKITPVLYLDSIEDSLAFWTDTLGFEQIATVPHEDKIGFVILQLGDLEVMLQTWSSLQSDAPTLMPAASAARAACGTSLYVEVDDLTPFKTRIPAAQLVLPERVTFYGMREIGVRAPSGHCVLLSARESGATAVD